MAGAIICGRIETIMVHFAVIFFDMRDLQAQNGLCSVNLKEFPFAAAKQDFYKGANEFVICSAAEGGGARLHGVVGIEVMDVVGRKCALTLPNIGQVSELKKWRA